MNRRRKPTQQEMRLRRYSLAIAVGWSVFVAAGFLWHTKQERAKSFELALVQARHSFEKDLVYRRWAADHGGVYVPATGKTPPNPYLSHIEDRDITTPSGKKLTLVNPAYMTRQVHELGREQYGHKGHITSLNPLRPENSPDPWETESLHAFQRGEIEVASLELIKGEEYLRLMRPLFIEEGCMKCHSGQGYKIGDLRGGISVSILMAPLLDAMKRYLATTAWGYGLIWLAGMGGIVFGTLRIAGHVRRRDRAESELAEEKNRYEAAALASGHVLYDWDSETDQVLYGGDVENVLGYTPEEMNGELSQWVKLIHPDDRPDFAALMDRLRKTREPAHRETYRIRRKDGEYIFVEDNGRFSLDAEGNLVRMVGFVEDITERKQVEDLLREREERFRLLFENAIVGIGISNKSGRVLSVNKTMCEMTGYSLEEFSELNIGDTYVDPDDRKRIFDILEKKGELRDFEVRMLNKQGRPYWSNLSMRPIQYENEDAFLTTSIDITERKLADEALRASEEKLRNIIESSSNLFYSHTPDHLLTYLSPQVEQILGYKPEEAMKEWPRLFTDNPINEKGLEIAHRAIDTGERQEPYDLEFFSKSGHKIRLKIREAPVVIDGKTVAIVGAATNITHEFELEQQLRQAQKMEAVGQLAGGVAHDFNNILQAIFGYVRFAKEGLSPDEQRFEDIEQIGKAAEKAAKLTKQLLAVSRRQIMQPRDLDLNDLVAGVLKMIRRVIGEHIDLNFIPGRRSGSVHADPGQMEQVLMNLCVNARDTMPEGGRLLIETSHVLINGEFCKVHPWAEEGQYVLLCVTDTGHGMDEETKNRAFEPFFTTKEVGKGTGLGLATVYGIVKHHDGMTHIYSEVGKGTSVNIYLPLVEDKAVDPDNTVEEAVPGGTETILVAEDDEAVRRLVVRILDEAGYRVIPAADGQEAVDLIKEHAGAISLALLDVIMPKLGGQEVYHELMEINPEVRALFSSGYSDGAIHTRFVIDKGMQMIRKPYDPEALLRKIRETLDER